MDYSYLTEISGEQLFKECLQRCGLNLTNVILDEWVLMRNKKVLVNVKKDSAGMFKYYIRACLFKK
ncbi:hypothetical protein Tola_1886 [Tolumonas auensis DSM 9187]|uniref:Uncharacterized protein n=1 Tax=Tolumonas auensis (strain DSM 9187 / NBRC 110442 / TA 4) TaxID=595494 RepID=C4LFX2_TOLAT|nr:hypothetical protein Tola_1886 [Tolumonas auensis DSM 9187]